ncbi:MAG: ATP-binding protein [Chloroflexi bacterium]|nr:ATP-binding protein [Chloroflexota bacterium]
MLSALFASVADALISYAIDKLDPAERIKSWLWLDPARLAFKKALARAYSAFTRLYPEYTSSLFDQSFLSTDALPELSKLLTRNQHPDPALLAQAWGRSLGASADFAKAATKPAAYFIERFEAELKAEPALQFIFDSRALESLPKLEAEIQKLSAELQRGLDEALKVAQNYQQATIRISGDVIGDGIIIGNNNQLTINKYYYSGDFIALNEYYIPPDGVFQRVCVVEFVGREWLTAKVDAFLNDPNRKSGAFLLIGDAGVGKTAFMAHLVKERRYLHLFAEQAPGQAMLQRAMQSLASQLVTRYQIDPYKDRDTLNALSVFPDFLERILRLAASTLTEGEKIVIVCDALDEAGVFPDHFVFGLPKELPDGVYFILSQRPVNVKLPNFEPVIEKLEAQGEGNLQDMQAYLSAVAKRPEVMGQIRSKEYSEDFFIQTLKEKSQGVWMYLHYIIKEIESGARAPLDLANLPTGLVGYYAEYWDAWRTGKRGKGEEAWDELYAPLLTTLAAAQEAIPVDWLIRWADVTAKPREVNRLLTEQWRAFITEKEKDGQKTYTPYHLSFKDFITGRVDTSKLQPAQVNLVKDLAAQTVDTHKQIVDALEKECKSEWDKLVEQDYPRLYLTAHLHGAGEYERLRMLLTDGDEKINWAEAREKQEGVYDGYLSDLAYVWMIAERENNYILAVRCMLIENSIQTIISNIGPNLIADLCLYGIWSYPLCLQVVKLKSDYEQAEIISMIASHLPQVLMEEALEIGFKMESQDWRRDRLFEALAPYVGAEQFSRMQRLYSRAGVKSLQELRENNKLSRHQDMLQTDQTAIGREEKIINLQSALAQAKKIGKLGFVEQLSCLISLMPHIKDKQRSQVVAECLAALNSIGDESVRARLICDLASYTNAEQRITLYDVANKFQDVGNRIQVLGILGSLLDGEAKDETHRLALSFLKQDNSGGYGTFGNFDLFSRGIKDLAPHLSDKLKDEFVNLIEEKFYIYYKVREMIVLLGMIVEYLDGDLKNKVVDKGFSSAVGIDYLPYGHDYRVSYISYFIEHLNNATMSNALKLALKFDGNNRAMALAALIPNLSRDLRDQAIRAYIANVERYPQSLFMVLPYLTGDDLKRVLIHAEEKNWLDDLTHKTLIAAGDPTHLPPSALRDPRVAGRLAGAIEVNMNTIQFRLLPYVDSQLQEEIIHNFFQKLSSSDKFIFSELGPYLNDELWEQALSIFKDVKDEKRRIDLFVTALPFLKGKNKLSAYLQLFAFPAKAAGDPYKTPWNQIIGRIKAPDDSMDVGMYITFLHSASKWNRKIGYEALDFLLPGLLTLPGEKTAEQLLDTITDVTRWWP